MVSRALAGARMWRHWSLRDGEVEGLAHELSQPAKREEEGQLTLLVSDSRVQLNNGKSSHGRLSLATQH